MKLRKKSHFKGGTTLNLDRATPRRKPRKDRKKNGEKKKKPRARIELQNNKKKIERRFGRRIVD